MLQLRVLGIKWHKPVGKSIEKTKALHFRKTTKIYVSPLTLHIYDFLNTAFKFLHFALFVIRIQNIFQRVVVFFFNTKLRYLVTLIAHQCWHYLFTDTLFIAFGILTIYYLHLQFQQIVTHLLA